MEKPSTCDEQWYFTKLSIKYSVRALRNKILFIKCERIVTCVYKKKN